MRKYLLAFSLLLLTSCKQSQQAVQATDKTTATSSEALKPFTPSDTTEVASIQGSVAPIYDGSNDKQDCITRAKKMSIKTDGTCAYEVWGMLRIQPTGCSSGADGDSCHAQILMPPEVLIARLHAPAWSKLGENQLVTWYKDVEIRMSAVGDESNGWGFDIRPNVE